MGRSHAHDVLFTDQARVAFCARLRNFNHSYAEIADELERVGLPRPSASGPSYRALILRTIQMNPGDAIHIAETMARFWSRDMLLRGPDAITTDDWDNLLVAVESGQYKPTRNR